MNADDLTRTDRAILDVLKKGKDSPEPWGIATKGMLVDETSFSRNSVYNRLEVLREAGCVELIHGPTRVFKFVMDPRDTNENNEIATDGGQLKKTIQLDLQDLEWKPFECDYCGEPVQDSEDLYYHARECAGLDMGQFGSTEKQ